MKRRILWLPLLLAAILASCTPRERTLVLLSTNDMHARIQRFPQPGHRSGKAVVFFMQLVHQFNTIPFDVRKKYRLHAVLNVHNVKFQQRGQFLAVHPELRPVVLWHPIHG